MTAHRILAEIFEAPDPCDVEAHDAWHAEQDALELAGRILGSMTRSDRLDLAVRLDVLGFEADVATVFGAVPASPAHSTRQSPSIFTRFIDRR